MSAARELQTSAWDAECRHDLDGLLAHFHPDAVFHPAGQPAKQGHDAIRKMTEDFYRSFPELSIEILREWGDGEDSAAFEFRAHLVNVEGERFTLDGMILVEIDGGKFRTVRYYEDAPAPVVG